MSQTVPADETEHYTLSSENMSDMFCAYRASIDRGCELTEAINTLSALRSQGRYCPQEALDAAVARVAAAEQALR